jgi:hypothetical protein
VRGEDERGLDDGRRSFPGSGASGLVTRGPGSTAPLPPGFCRPRSNNSFSTSFRYGLIPRPVFAVFTPRQYALRARLREG